MYRSQLIPLRLNRAQANYMARAAGCARFAYNWALSEWKRQAREWWESDKVSPYPSAQRLQKQFNAIKSEQFPWFADVTFYAAFGAIFALGQAFEAWQAGGARYPRFKSRAASKRSFMACGTGREFRVEGKYIVLPRIGHVRMTRDARWPNAPLTNAVVSERGGKWYVAIGFELPDAEAAPRAHEAAGVDLGIKQPLVVTAGATTLRFGESLAERLNVERRKLKRANRRLHRRVPGSRRRDRARQQVARIHVRMSSIRADVQHKATCQIAGMASRIGLETLAVRNLLRNGRLARSIADVGFYEVRRQLEYKADQVFEADRFYPSSKTCSACGSIKQDLKLSDRTFKCECGHECDRDENAARNLEQMAANRAVSVRGAGSSAPRRKLRLSSLARKREAEQSARFDSEV